MCTSCFCNSSPAALTCMLRQLSQVQCLHSSNRHADLLASTSSKHTMPPLSGTACVLSVLIMQILAANRQPKRRLTEQLGQDHPVAQASFYWNFLSTSFNILLESQPDPAESACLGPRPCSWSLAGRKSTLRSLRQRVSRHENSSKRRVRTGKVAPRLIALRRT